MPRLAYRTTLPRPDDPELLETIAHHLGRGIPLRFAAPLAGISEHTAYHWVTKGEELLADPDYYPGVLGSYALFGQTVKEARARCVLAETNAWDAADGKTWAKHATKLERLFPGEYAKLRDPGTQVNIGTLNMVALTTDVSPETLAELLALAQERIAGSAPLQLPPPTELQQ
jgi:hypothetical protein